jgi:signal peptidase I
VVDTVTPRSVPTARAGRLTRRTVLTAVCWLVAALVWWAVAPPQVGGTTRYVVVSGISMQPTFYTDDLAVIRQAGSYRVGDVIAFRSPTVNAVLLHRVVAANATGFTTKGDNNGWIDPDHIRTTAIVGKVVLTVPKAGGVLSSPVAAIVAAMILIVLLALPTTQPRTPSPSTEREPRAPAPTRQARVRHRWMLLAAGFTGVTALAALGTLWWPTTQPTTVGSLT